MTLLNKEFLFRLLLSVSFSSLLYSYLLYEFNKCSATIVSHCSIRQDNEKFATDDSICCLWLRKLRKEDRNLDKMWTIFHSLEIKSLDQGIKNSPKSNDCRISGNLQRSSDSNCKTALSVRFHINLLQPTGPANRNLCFLAFPVTIWTIYDTDCDIRWEMCYVA